ncbi:MAG: maltose alpha-D-glucosyltransferase, partial [Calditrichia bacterium]
MAINLLSDDPLWYKDAIIYELHIKSFADSSGDGIGDFGGLIRKLDYLESLGITAIWLLPFYPSPLRDDGYDIADYFDIHPDYGKLSDFKRFLKESHKRGIRVITELVINHTSVQHPWFQRARQSKPGSVYRDFYVWSDTPEKYGDTRIIFQDFESSNWSWDPVAKAYYWHRFYSHQPDLNYDNPRVQKEIFRILDFWFKMGVDGLRLDAIPYLYQREGTNCENLPETHQFLKKLRDHVDSRHRNKMLLAEANQWPEDAVAYFGDGDECHMAFHFPVMPRLFMALRMEDSFPVIDIMDQTPEIPENCQWAMFLRNHDELTLEMVTDEERDYMYRVYAKDPRSRINLGIRRRLAPLLENNHYKIQLLNIILFSLPGTPVIYYGDEIGMGDNYYLGDRDGVRTPMQWSSDRNAGFSSANPHQLYLPVIIESEYHYEALNVENQERNLSSPLWWMKRVIAMRKHYKAFSRGTLRFLDPDNPKVLCFVREFEEEIILVVLNLSRFTQVARIDLAEFRGYTPKELFSLNEFPQIPEQPYLLTMGPYGHYWLLLEKEKGYREYQESDQIPEISVNGPWHSILNENKRVELENEILPKYLKKVRWFGGKARPIQQVKIGEILSLPRADYSARILILEVQYRVGAGDRYLLPLAFTPHPGAGELLAKYPGSVIAHLQVNGQSGILFDGIYKEDFRVTLLDFIARRSRSKGINGELVAIQGREFKKILGKESPDLTSRVLNVEQSNSSIIYDNKFFLKMYRRVEEGQNPDPEVVRFLTEKGGFAHVPAYAGSIEYQLSAKETLVLALLQEYEVSQGNSWDLALDAVKRFIEQAISHKSELKSQHFEVPSWFNTHAEQLPELLRDLIDGILFDQVSLLGKRTAEMHRSLSRIASDPVFKPEPFSQLYQRALYQSLRSNAVKNLRLLEKQLNNLPEEMQERAKTVLSLKRQIQTQLKKILNQ